MGLVTFDQHDGRGRCSLRGEPAEALVDALGQYHCKSQILTISLDT